MAGEMDSAKGKVKETAGDLTGNDDLKAEGKTDRLSGDIKGKIDGVKDAAEGLVDKVKDKLHKD